MKSVIFDKNEIVKFIVCVFAVGLLAGNLILSGSAQEIARKPIKNQRKIALLIGISKYESATRKSSYRNLNTDLDVELLKETLTGNIHKFLPENITVLQDEKATRDAILSAMKKISYEAKEGDIVFIYFGGHGKSIPDDGDDEADGYDESLIPYDYVTKNDDSKNIRDDEIGKILSTLKQRKPASVLIAFDSCFSGTATRGDFAGRGGEQEIIKPVNESPSGLKDKNVSYPKEFVFLAAASANPPQIASEIDLSPSTIAKQVPLKNETIYKVKDGKGMPEMGVFTLGLVIALNEVTPNTTYRDLFERIGSIVSARKPGQQTPQIEGSLDEIVFDGKAVRQERYFKIVSNPENVKQVILPIGYLHGATVKSRFAIHDAGTKDLKDNSKKITEGEIIKTNALTSILELEKPIDKDKLRVARAFEIRHNYEDLSLKVIFQNIDQIKGGDKISAEFIKDKSRNDVSTVNKGNFDLAEFSNIERDENLKDKIYDVKIYPISEKEVKDKIVSEDFRGLILERKDGSILGTIAESSDMISNIKSALESEYRFRIVKSLKDTEDAGMSIRLNLIKVELERDENGEPALNNGRKICSDRKIGNGEIPRNTGGQAQLKIDDCIMMEIQNVSDSDVYFTILNLRADRKIAPGFPQKDGGVPNFLQKGKTFLIPLPYSFRITNDSIGEESFIAIATKEPTDFTPLIDDKFTRTTLDERGAAAFDTPLGKILMSAKRGTRSQVMVSAPPSWAISSYSYKIVE